MACVRGRCEAAIYDPVAPLFPAPGGAPSAIGWYHTATAGAAADAAAGGWVGALLEVGAGAMAGGFDLLVTAYRPAALCPPGAAGTNDSRAVQAGPAPFADFRGAPAVVELEGGNATALARGRPCAPCAPGTAAPARGATACAACAAGGFQASTGASACDDCPAGSYQPAAGATACAECPAGASATLLRGAAAETACFAARVAVERVWLSGRSLAAAVTWSLRPAGHAGAGDVVALFFEPGPEAGPPRQLGWAYTSAAGLVAPLAFPPLYIFSPPPPLAPLERAP